ncbi:hypothetical protein G6F42_016460 [Rhizopus arrhizus]|nr:hypothetical protein G6F42_016460 [Rhizopus arrhizus]
MNSQGAKLEELVEKTHQVSSDEERKEVAEQANKIHEKVTGHAMTIDEHGNIETNTEEAKKCCENAIHHLPKVGRRRNLNCGPKVLLNPWIHGWPYCRYSIQLNDILRQRL